MGLIKVSVRFSRPRFRKTNKMGNKKTNTVAHTGSNTCPNISIFLVLVTDPTQDLEKGDCGANSTFKCCFLIEMREYVFNECRKRNTIDTPMIFNASVAAKNFIPYIIVK